MSPIRQFGPETLRRLLVRTGLPVKSSHGQLITVGVNHGDRGDESPEFGVGTLMKIVPQILSCCKISSTRVFALQCSKKAYQPITLTVYSLLAKSTSSTSSKSPLQLENSKCFWQGHGRKYRS